MKHCVDCRWHQPPEFRGDNERDVAGYSKCLAPQNDRGDTSRVVPLRTFNPRVIFCDIQRSVPWLLAVILGQCGMGARWFQPKDGAK